MKSAKVKPILSVIIGIVCFVLLTLFDQITKQWAVLHLYGQKPIVLIQNVFQLQYLENRGAAFGVLQGRRTMFIILTIVVLALIAYLYARIPFKRKYRILRILMVVIAAGAVGNFIDRVSQNYVVDFFYIKAIDFPIFNVADIYVTCGVIILALFLIFKYKDDDFTEMFQSLRFKKKVM